MVSPQLYFLKAPAFTSLVRVSGRVQIEGSLARAPGGGGGGGTLIFSYIRWLGPFLGFKILNFVFLGVSRKININWGMIILWIFFGVIAKEVISMHFKVFS